MDVDLPCHACGYDLRAHPQDGLCPECGASVAESIRFAAIPLRPAWRDSDPRWRRHILAGIWILALLPLMDVVQMLGWASKIRVPTLFDYRGPITLDETFLGSIGVYQPLIFCIGVVLLFTKERGRRRNPLDWTRRWGVLCSYVVLLLSAVPILFISALVMTGISALLISIPPKYQPSMTQRFAQISTAYLRYGPHSKPITIVAVVVFSSIVILLACIPLFDALRSTGAKRLAIMLLAPLALFSLLHFTQIARYCLGFPTEFYRYQQYFCPQLLIERLAALPPGVIVSGSMPGAFVEAVKWCIVLAIAVWLSIARLVVWRQGKKTSGA